MTLIASWGLFPVTPTMAEELAKGYQLVEDWAQYPPDMQFEPTDLCQIVMPNETDLDGVTTLNEVSGRARLEGRARGVELSMDGPGVFEFIRG